MGLFNKKKTKKSNPNWSYKSSWGDCWTLWGNNTKEMTDIDMLVDDED